MSAHKDPLAEWSAVKEITTVTKVSQKYTVLCELYMWTSGQAI